MPVSEIPGEGAGGIWSNAMSRPAVILGIPTDPVHGFVATAEEEVDAAGVVATDEADVVGVPDTGATKAELVGPGAGPADGDES